MYKSRNIKFQTFAIESSSVHGQYLYIILYETYQTCDFSLTNIYHKRHELLVSVINVTDGNLIRR